MSFEIQVFLQIFNYRLLNVPAIEISFVVVLLSLTLLKMLYFIFLLFYLFCLMCTCISKCAFVCICLHTWREVYIHSHVEIIWVHIRIIFFPILTIFIFMCILVYTFVPAVCSYVFRVYKCVKSPETGVSNVMSQNRYWKWTQLFWRPLSYHPIFYTIFWDSSRAEHTANQLIE